MSIEEIQIVDGNEGPRLPIVDGDGIAYAVIWPGMGARTRSLHRICLGRGACTTALRHRSDAVYYVIDGSGSVNEPGSAETQGLRAGSMFHVDGDTTYVVTAGQDGIEIIGGPAPADEAMYAHLNEAEG